MNPNKKHENKAFRNSISLETKMQVLSDKQCNEFLNFNNKEKSQE